MRHYHKPDEPAQIAVGSRVAYSVQFLRSIGDYTDLAHARGTVKEIRQLGSTSLAVIAWDKGDYPPKVNVANLALIGPNSKFASC